MFRISSRSKAITLTVLGPVLAFSLVACGGGSSGSGSATSTSNPSASGGPGGAPGGFNGADMTKILACLKAAGIDVPTGSDFPRPSGSFSPGGTPPSGARPSGGPGGGGGANGGLFNSPQAQAALKACGITMPTGGGGPNATPTS